MKFATFLLCLYFCNFVHGTDDIIGNQSRLSFRKFRPTYGRNIHGSKILKKRRKVLKRRPNGGQILPYNRDSRCKFNFFKSTRALRSLDSTVFSIFTIVRFQNEPCQTSAMTNGTCYTKYILVVCSEAFFNTLIARHSLFWWTEDLEILTQCVSRPKLHFCKHSR